MAVIITDMERVPTKCINCQLLGRDSMYCQLHPRKDLSLVDVVVDKPEWCPLKEVSNNKFVSMQETMEQLGITAEEVENAEDLEFTVEPLFDKSVLEQIKAEVLEYIDDLDIANEICGVFDRHISGKDK